MIFSIVAFVGTVISIVLGLTIGVNVLGFTDGFILRSVANTLLILAGVNILCAICFQNLLINRINPLNKHYSVQPWEEKIYLKLGVRKWKDKIPELGKLFAGFDKSQIGDKSNNDHVLYFISQTITAEYIHSFSAVLGLLAIFACLQTWHIVGIPLLLANTIINVMPVMVQRYNRPKLMKLYLRNCNNQKQKQVEQKEEA